MNNSDYYNHHILINQEPINSLERPKCSYSKCINSHNHINETNFGGGIKSLLRLSANSGISSKSSPRRFEQSTMNGDDPEEGGGDTTTSYLYKACHYCYTFYCSKECRLLDWTHHKTKSCYYGRLSSCCKKILTKVGRNGDLRYELSKIARAAYSSTNQQRGFIWLDFSSANEAQQFLVQPIDLENNNKNRKSASSSPFSLSSSASNFLFYFGDNLLPKYVCFTPNDKLEMDAKLRSVYYGKKEDEGDEISSCDEHEQQLESARYKSNIVLSLLFHHHFTRLRDLNNYEDHLLNKKRSGCGGGGCSSAWKKNYSNDNNGCDNCSRNYCQPLRGSASTYSHQNKLLNSSHYSDDEFKQFNDLCQSYDPSKEFILLVSVRINPDDISDNLTPRKTAHTDKNAMYVLKFLKLNLLNGKNKNGSSGLKRKQNQNSPTQTANKSSAAAENETPLTLILTSLKNKRSSPSSGIENNKFYENISSINLDDHNYNYNNSNYLACAATSSFQSNSSVLLMNETGENKEEAASAAASEERQLFLANLLSEFDMRGIKLRQKYPKIYRDLCLYVEENRPFTPVCLFPRDLNKNNIFMCLIMPNSEPEDYAWLSMSQSQQSQQSQSSQFQPPRQTHSQNNSSHIQGHSRANYYFQDDLESAEPPLASSSAAAEPAGVMRRHDSIVSRRSSTAGGGGGCGSIKKSVSFDKELVKVHTKTSNEEKQQQQQQQDSSSLSDNKNKNTQKTFFNHTEYLYIK